MLSEKVHERQKIAAAVCAPRSFYGRKLQLSWVPATSARLGTDQII
jgi:hypothetical protein